MNDFTVRLYRRTFADVLRTFADVLTIPDVEIVPVRWGTMAVGGPEYAILEATGPLAALWQMVNGGGWLRYGVEILNRLGTPIWWGYVESATLASPEVSVSVSLEDVANSIAVEYGTGNTGFAENADSVAEYGRKQKALSVGSELAGSVAQRQATELSYSAAPRPMQDIRRAEESAVTLRCVGWLKSLGWLYYERVEGLVEYVGTGSREQPFGLGIEGNEFWFVAENRELNDTGMHLYGFTRGQRITVSGSAANNTIYTVARATTDGPASVTISHQLNFLASNKTIYRYGSTGPGELAWLRPGDRIRITGTSSNNGWFRVTGVSPSWADMWITVADSLVNEIATNPLLWRGHAIGLEEQPVEEKPGAMVSLVVDARNVGQQFVPPTAWTAWTVSLKIRKVGTPADSVRVGIYSNNAGIPGTTLKTTTLAASSISANSTWTDFTFSTGLAMTGGTTYWIVVERTGSVDPINYYTVAVDEDAGYGAGFLRMWSGGAWAARTVDASMIFRVLGQEDTTTQIAELVDGAGQFFTDAIVESVSGVETNQYRAGAVDALTELTDLLEIGTTNGRRLLCEATRARALRVWEEPGYSGSPDYVRRLSGEIVTLAGVPVQPGELIAGKWLQAEIAVLPGRGMNEDPTLLFVERCEYDAAARDYSITPRGAANIWRLAAVPRQG